MSIKNCYPVLLLISVVLTKSLPINETATHSKISNYGSRKLVPNEGRSSGLSLYSQSSNAKVLSGQNLRAKVVYYTPKPSRIGQVKNEPLPAKGEVQERFNPRPYFDYASVQSNTGNSESTKDISKPSVVYGAPFDSFPVFNGPSDSKPSEVDAKPSDFDSGPEATPPANYVSAPKPKPDIDLSPPRKPSDLYDSPYDSYNPPQKSEVLKPQNSPVYPPIDSPKPDIYSPPSKPNDDVKNQYPGYPYAPPELDHPPNDGDSYMLMAPGKDVELDYNSKEVGSYVPMGASKPQMDDNGPLPKPPSHGYHDYSSYSDVGPRIVATVKPPEPADNPYQDYHYHDEKQHIVDLPPPAISYSKIPQYLDHDPKEHGYNYPEFVHVEHPIYHEVTTTTTTEAPEDERVNKGHYSYYYLGRKLWYIPLYFSAYFIIYITILILKSIARHKVNFIHDFHDLAKSRRSGRNMNFEELTLNVTSAIDTAQQRYMRK